MVRGRRAVAVRWGGGGGGNTPGAGSTEGNSVCMPVAPGDWCMFIRVGCIMLR